VVQSKFRNDTASAQVYWTSNYNTTTGATSTNGTLTASSNTDIAFIGCEFYAGGANDNIVRITDSTNASFTGSAFISASTGQHAFHIDVPTDDIFKGPLTITGCLFENPMYAFYLEGHDTTLTYWYYINVTGNYFNLYTPGTTLMKTTDTDPYYTQLYNLTWSGNRTNTEEAGYARLDVTNLTNSFVDHYSQSATVSVYGSLVESVVNTMSITFNGSAAAIRSFVLSSGYFAGRINFGTTIASAGDNAILLYKSDNTISGFQYEYPSGEHAVKIVVPNGYTNKVKIGSIGADGSTYYGGVEFYGDGATRKIKLTGMATYDNNATATSGGLEVGEVYQTPNGALMIVY
jgi:hypothetical protein